MHPVLCRCARPEKDFNHHTKMRKCHTNRRARVECIPFSVAAPVPKKISITTRKCGSATRICACSSDASRSLLRRPSRKRFQSPHENADVPLESARARRMHPVLRRDVIAARIAALGLAEHQANSPRLSTCRRSLVMVAVRAVRLANQSSSAVIFVRASA